MSEPLELDLVCDDLRLNCWSIHPTSDPRGTIVFLHGIPSTAAPDPADRGYRGLAAEAAEKGWTAIWADMRGVRGSEGYFSIEGWVRDASSVVEIARRQAGDKVALVGSSAGGAVSTEAVRRGADVDALALLAAPAAWLTFASNAASGLEKIMADTGMALAPEVHDDPATWAAEFREVTTENSIADIKVPLLLLHGTADDVVPVDHAHRLAARAPDAEVHILEGAAHQLRRDPGAVNLLFDWLDRTL